MTDRPALFPRFRPGLTLVEMLVVIGILGMLLALGVGSYWAMAKNYKEEGAAAHLDVMLRQLRNSSLATNAPSYLDIDSERNTFTPWATKTVALWHFEDSDGEGRVAGSRHNAGLRGARVTTAGKIGKCVRISNNAYVDAGSDPDFDLDDGGTIECYIKPDAQIFTGDNYIFNKNGCYSLRIVKWGILVGEIGATKHTKAVRVYSKTYKIVPGRWTKVALSWDRNITRVLADDQILATGAGAIAPVSMNPLTVGEEGSGMEGLVDEVRILGAISGGAFELPKTFTITHNTAPWNAVYFAGDGSLDMRYHTQPVSITFEQDGRGRAVTVSMFGTTLRHEVEKIQKTADNGTRDSDKGNK